MFLVAPMMSFLFWFGSTEIRPDEVVVFYPTFARPVDEAGWLATIHGIVYEPEEGSLRRSTAIAALRRMLQLEKGSPESQTFEQRARLFLADNERGKRISIRLGRAAYELSPSAANGHFAGSLRLSAAEAEDLQRRPGSGPDAGWISFQAIMPPGDPRRFAGRLQLVPARGLSIVSDIDDTVKITCVADRTEMAANTFARPFRAVAGMAEVYRRAAETGAAIHYVSGSPWQLYPPLAEFFESEAFPRGTFHLKSFRWTDKSVFNLLTSQEKHKQAAIGELLAAFPQRRFVLIRDSGERDPEIYGSLARGRAEQIVGVFIRRLADQPEDPGRYAAAFRGLAAGRWRLFAEAAELEPPLLELAAQNAGRGQP